MAPQVSNPCFTCVQGSGGQIFIQLINVFRIRTGLSSVDGCTKAKMGCRFGGVMFSPVAPFLLPHWQKPQFSTAHPTLLFWRSFVFLSIDPKLILLTKPQIHPPAFLSTGVVFHKVIKGKIKPLHLVSASQALNLVSDY